jgi:hypothetical protein
MNTSRQLPSVLTWLLITAPIAGADVVIGGADLLVGYGSPHPEYSWTALLIDRSPSESVLGVRIGYLGNGDYEFSTGLIALNYHVFLAYPGMQFTPEYVGANWTEALDAGGAPNPVHYFALHQTLYFAYWSDVYGSAPDIPDNTDDYGWVTLTHTGSELFISDSVTALGGGIVVGTTTQLPEPYTLMLLGVGSLAICISTWCTPRVLGASLAADPRPNRRAHGVVGGRSSSSAGNWKRSSIGRPAGREGEQDEEQDREQDGQKSRIGIRIRSRMATGGAIAGSPGRPHAREPDLSRTMGETGSCTCNIMRGR